MPYDTLVFSRAAALCAILFLSAGCGEAPIAPVTMETITDITSRDSFRGEHGKAYAHVCPGLNRNDDRRSFLITVNGFDPERVDREPEPGELEATCARHDADANYHLVVSQWRSGADFIQRNAGAVRALIEQLSEKYDIDADDRLAIVGYSMGGVVARYALQAMEAEGVAHNADLFISVDSPQQGAYIPIGVQYIAKVFEDYGAQSMLDTIDLPASRQMLIYHYRQGDQAQTWTDDFAELYLHELQGALGGFPRGVGLRTVGVSSGRVGDTFDDPVPGERYYHGRLSIERSFEHTQDIPVCGTLRLPFEVQIHVEPQAWSLGLAHLLPTPLVPRVRVARSDVHAEIDGIDIDATGELADHFLDVAVTELGGICGAVIDFLDLSGPVEKIVAAAVAQGRNVARPYTDDLDEQSFSVPASTGLSAGAPGGLSDAIGQLRDELGANGFEMLPLDPDVENQDTNVFIPLSSALLLSGVSRTSGLSRESLRAASAFDEVYFEPLANLLHLESSQHWFEQEVDALFDATW